MDLEILERSGKSSATTESRKHSTKGNGENRKDGFRREDFGNKEITESLS